MSSTEDCLIQGIQTQQKKWVHPDVDKARKGVFVAYIEGKMPMSAIAEKFDITEAAIRTIMSDARTAGDNTKRKAIPHTKVSAEMRTEIANFVIHQGWPRIDVAGRFGVCVDTVRRIVRAAQVQSKAVDVKK